MRILFTLIWVAAISFSLSANNDHNSDENNKNSTPENQSLYPENVKSKSAFVIVEDKTVSLPLGYSFNSQMVFGAKYLMEGDNMCAENPKDIEFFLSPIQEGQLVDVYYEEAGPELGDISNSKGKFLISINKKGNSDLYIVEFEDGHFSKPRALEINTKYDETSGAFNITGDKIVFASNRPGGFGGYDIYETELVGKGKWSTPKNLGNTINTELDEQCPYLLSDGLTLYFSSMGHQSDGNYDIYITTQGDMGQWYDPEKLGSPINSDKDDLFYRVSPDETRAVYFTSGEKGEGIYELIFN
ncbi:MAG: hypothetical protein C0592_03870 [Marinilabiliales bacterium]|nr:MAG: hypothetical protein C0592_03870 [Marinilabiliales bacterium]